MSNAVGYIVQGIFAVFVAGALLFSFEGDRIERMWNHTPPPITKEPPNGK